MFINSSKQHLTETEENIVVFINENIDRISSMSIVDVAEQTYSSPATVSRAIRKCGIGGFSELRYQIAQHSQTSKNSIEINDIFNKSIFEISATIDHLSSEDVLKVVEEIQNAPRIFIFSRGLSELVAAEFALKLQLLGYDVCTNSDPFIMRSIAERMHRKDLLIVFSLSGNTEELIAAVNNARFRGARVVCCTCGNPTAPLAQMANLTLFGYKHQHVSIKFVDATSRLPLYVISRVIVDCLTLRNQDKNSKIRKR